MVGIEIDRGTLERSFLSARSRLRSIQVLVTADLDLERRGSPVYRIYALILRGFGQIGDDYGDIRGKLNGFITKELPEGYFELPVKASSTAVSIAATADLLCANCSCSREERAR